MSEPCYHLIRVTFQQKRKENLQALPCAGKWEERDDLNQLRAGPCAALPGRDAGCGAGRGRGPRSQPSEAISTNCSQTTPAKLKTTPRSSKNNHAVRFAVLTAPTAEGVRAATQHKTKINTTSLCQKAFITLLGKRKAFSGGFNFFPFSLFFFCYLFLYA